MSSKNFQSNVILVGVVLSAAIVSYQYFHSVQMKYLSVTSFSECVEAGYEVLPMYPEKCVMSGKSFMNPLQKVKAQTPLSENASTTPDFKNLTYLIDGQNISFLDGEGHLPPNNLLRKSTTTLIIDDRAFFYDINQDSIKDAILLLHTNEEPSELRTYYIALATSLHTGYLGANALYVDTSLASGAFTYKNGQIILGYNKHTATTTLQEKYYILENSILKQVSTY